MKIILFSGKNCAACKQLHKRIEPLIEELGIDVRVYDDDTAPDFDETCELVEKYDVRSVPTLVKVLNDSVYTSIEGYNPEIDYEQQLRDMSDKQRFLYSLTNTSKTKQ